MAQSHIANESEAGWIEAMKGRKLAVGAPPFARQRGEFFDFPRVDGRAGG